MFITTLVSLVYSYLAFKVLQALYRLTFHPLANFPGPKLAAASRWYEVYFEVFVGGVWSDQISSIHEQYGPIVRISPNELHIKDPEYYDTIFNFNPHLDKRAYALDNLQHTPSHSQHKLRRHALDPFFSRATITSLESSIRDNISQLCSQLQAAKTTSTPVNISLLYRCLTTDIITSYCFGRNFKFLSSPPSTIPFFAAFTSGFKTFFLLRELKLVERLAFYQTLLPAYLLPPQSTSMGNFLRVLQSISTDTVNAAAQTPNDHSRRTILTELPYNTKLPPSERTPELIFSNAVMLVSAGLETTAHVLETATLHLHTPSNAHMLARLKAELTLPWPDATTSTPPLKTFETLPYLGAVIKESLRLALGVSARLSRINHHEAMRYGSWDIPAGTEVSMSQRDVHFDEEIYPEPWRFEPERWIGEEGREKARWLVSFSRGSRGCIGMNLAMAELYITLAAVVRKFDMALYESDRRDVDVKYDYFVPIPETGAKGVSVLIL